MKILFIESDITVEYNCSNWRCVMPARGLLKAGYSAKVIRLEPWVAMEAEAVRETEEADLIFLQRNLFGDAIRTLFYWRSRGKRIVADIDDSYENMTEDTGSPSTRFWRESITKDEQGREVRLSPGPLFQLRAGVKLCGALSSPSQLICDDWKEYAKTYWFPNFLDLNIYRRQYVTIEPGKLYVGWGGSMTHLVSWQKSGCAEAMGRIIREYPHVVLLIAGDPRIERFIPVPKTNRLAVGWVAQPVFMNHLSKFHIGLCPLYGEYDRRRSWLKPAEYSVMGIPWIGSDMEPNADAPTGVRVKNTADDWYNAIKFYVENHDAMQDAATRSMEVSAQKYGIQNNVDKLVTLFERIIKEVK